MFDLGTALFHFTTTDLGQARWYLSERSFHEEFESRLVILIQLSLHTRYVQPDMKRVNALVLFADEKEESEEEEEDEESRSGAED